MSIWFKKDLSLDDLKPLGKDTMAEHIGIQWLEVGENFLKATMPVDSRTRQPYGLLHGGASVALAETIGSVGAAMVVDINEYICVGLDINANHLRSAKSGLVTGIATPIHIGGSTQVWEIKIYDDREKLVCISRLTVAVLKKRE
jgi:1,4-dihydroxy-2-naphthoyl-CoA hydrolase